MRTTEHETAVGTMTYWGNGYVTWFPEERYRGYPESTDAYLRQLCAVVGHKVERCAVMSKAWTQCTYCSNHLSGDEPGLAEIIGWAYRPAILSGMVMRESPFRAALRAS